MRWLILQSAGEHDGKRDNWTPNHYLRECLSLQHALREHGETADVWGKRHANFGHRPDFKSYDVLLCIENYEPGWLPDFSSLQGPLKLQWCIDLHCGARSRLEKLTPHMDVVLHSTKALMDGYRKKFPNQKHIWFPNGYDSRYFHPLPNVPKTLNALFVGSVRNRGSWIKKMRNGLGASYRFATGRDMFTAIAGTKVHLNKAIKRDVNYRCFETIGMGTCLCTDRLGELEELGFRDGENCLLYDTDEECITKVRQALASGAWRGIGDRGRDFAGKHTYIERVRDLLCERRGKWRQ